MKKLNFKNIFVRTWRLAVSPAQEWQENLRTSNSLKEMFRFYLLPLLVVSGIVIFLLYMINYPVIKSGLLTLIYLLSSLAGAWISYFIIKEYLYQKIEENETVSLNLITYSSAIYMLLRGIGNAFDHVFIGQLFILFGFIFIRTLYYGIKELTELPARQHANLLIIASLAVASIPVIISQLLMIVFRIPVINI